MATREQIAAQAHNRRVHETADRVLRDIDRSVKRGLKSVAEFEKRLGNDPFKAIGLRADPKGRFLADPVNIDTGAMTLRIDILAAQDGQLHHLEEFSPRDYKTPYVRVEPIDLLVTQWGTLLSFRIDNFEISRPLKLRLVKRTKPSESQVCLIDSKNNKYYYPKATDLTGDIIAGHPRIGVIVFEPFQSATDSVAIHFTNAKLAQVRGASDTFSFTCIDSKMQQDIADAIASCSLTQRVREDVGNKAAEARSRVTRERDAAMRSIPKAGCLIAILLFPILMLFRR